MGEMINCHPKKSRPGTMAHLYQEMFDGLSIPIVTNFPIGHGREMWTLPFGVGATLNAEAKTIQLNHCGVV